VNHALHAAVDLNHLGALRFMLSHGLDNHVNAACGGCQPLHRAIRKVWREGDPGCEMAKSLLQHGASPDSPNQDGSTPLHDAATDVSLVAVSLLLEHGANPNLPNAMGETALHLVCSSMLVDVELQIKVVQVLLAWGADPSLRDFAGLRSLDHAALPFSIMGCQGSGSTKLYQQLSRAMRWQARRQALLIRCNGDSEGLVAKLPEDLFQTVVRFV